MEFNCVKAPVRMVEKSCIEYITGGTKESKLSLRPLGLYSSKVYNSWTDLKINYISINNQAGYPRLDS